MVSPLIKKCQQLQFMIIEIMSPFFMVCIEVTQGIKSVANYFISLNTCSKIDLIPVFLQL